MSNWINSRIDFGSPMALFVLSFKDIPNGSPLLKNMEEKDLQLLTLFVEEYIEVNHQSIGKGSLLGVQANFERQEFQFLYTSPTLTRSNSGEMCPRINLIPEQNNVCEASV